MPTSKFVFGTAEYWEERAGEALALAGAMTDPEARRAMLVVAENYERIAQRARARELGIISGRANYAKGS